MAGMMKTRKDAESQVCDVALRRLRPTASYEAVL